MMSGSESADFEASATILPAGPDESLFTRLRTTWAGVTDRLDSAGEVTHDAIEKPVKIIPF